MSTALDFSSVLNVAKKPDPLLGSLANKANSNNNNKPNPLLGNFDHLNGGQDLFAANPFLFTPGATSFAQGGFLGGQLGDSILSGAAGMAGSPDMLMTMGALDALFGKLPPIKQAPKTPPQPRTVKIDALGGGTSAKTEAGKINDLPEDKKAKN